MPVASTERLLAIAANICAVYHKLPYELGRLTDMQVYRILFHKRDKTGGIPIPESDVGFIAPEGTHTLEMELNFIDFLAVSGKWEPEYVEKLKQDLRNKYAKVKANGIQ